MTASDAEVAAMSDVELADELVAYCGGGGVYGQGVVLMAEAARRLRHRDEPSVTEVGQPKRAPRR
jgi:hypothetical protein